MKRRRVAWSRGGACERVVKPVSRVVTFTRERVLVKHFDKYTYTGHAGHTTETQRSAVLVFASPVSLVEFRDLWLGRIRFLGLRRGREGDGDHLLVVRGGGNAGLRLRLVHHIEDGGGSRVDVGEREGRASSLVGWWGV